MLTLIGVWQSVTPTSLATPGRNDFSSAAQLKRATVDALDEWSHSESQFQKEDLPGYSSFIDD
jgi:hypothetical protein